MMSIVIPINVAARGLRFFAYALSVVAASATLGVSPVFAEPTAVSPAEHYVPVGPAIGIDGNGNTVVAWTQGGVPPFAVFAQRVSATGVLTGPVLNVSPVDRFVTTKPAIAVSQAGNFVVAWVDGSDFATHAQRFLADGTAVGSAFQVSPTNHFSSIAPAVSVNRTGEFVVAWTTEAEPFAAFVQRYNASGAPIGDPLRASPPEHFVPRTPPATGIDDSGNFVVAWLDEGTIHAVHAQRFNADGTLAGSAFRVSPADHTTSNQNWRGWYGDGEMAPAVSMNAKGLFVIGWTKNGVEPFAAFAQRYSAKGSPFGAVVRASPPEHFVSSNGPAVAIDGLGAFLVAWVDEGFTFGVHAQRFTSSSKPDGTAFRVSPTTSFVSGNAPAATMNGSGSANIAWTDQNIRVLEQGYPGTAAGRKPPK